MAMTAQVKAEIANTHITKTCCRKAEVSTMLRFAGGLHIVSGKIVVEAELDTGAAARRLRKDIAEVFVRVLLAEAPRHSLYNSGGIPVSLGELADIVRGFIPDAKITFAEEGGREDSGNYLVDWSRLAKEFGIEYPGLHTRVLEVINDVRRHEGLPLVTGR